MLLLSACTDHRDNPEEIRRRTAQATETMRQDTKAVVDGVRDGMKSDNRPIDINKASREDLLRLPGLTEHEADRIVDGRPYDSTQDLVSRRIVSGAEYDKIRDRISAER
ncbi:MAG TPA: helix-hairpin-helix domain-containing protein [Candidatus Binatia bacterium]|nr:helix-hairpin-helix domain-containing protein [Candidatus Binatia bacterium]